MSISLKRLIKEQNILTFLYRNPCTTIKVNIFLVNELEEPEAATHSFIP